MGVFSRHAFWSAGFLAEQTKTNRTTKKRDFWAHGLSLAILNEAADIV